MVFTDGETIVPMPSSQDHKAVGEGDTGPNTGGKTVALKTVGLFALMAQCGLHVPAAPGSAMPVFRRIYADIGDDQSIAASLSSFSAHLGHLARFLDEAGPDTLVLCDERRLAGRAAPEPCSSHSPPTKRPGLRVPAGSKRASYPPEVATAPRVSRSTLGRMPPCRGSRTATIQPVPSSRRPCVRMSPPASTRKRSGA